MTKPIGSLCNLQCAYCYYLHKGRLLPDVMSRIHDDLLEEFIRQYIAEQDADTIFFSWHGGESTLLGLEFFRKVVQLQQQYAGKKRIENDLETNGLLLDEAWAQFLAKNQFLVGLSIDGPQYLHDHFRTNKEGGGSFDGACRAARLLQQYNVTFNTLTVVSSANVRHAVEVYQFLTEELGARRLQWLPCVEPKDFRTVAPGRWNTTAMPILGTPAARPGNATSVVTDWSVDPDEWGEFLCQTFQAWFEKDVGKVFVNWFESLLGQWMKQPPQICTLAETCGRSLVLEKDGSLYSCDHFVYPEYKVGNLRDENRRIADAVYCAQQRRFGCNKRESLSNYCKQCAYRFACNGGCPKDRFIKAPDGQAGLNYLCSGTKRFLTYADPYLREIIARVHPESQLVNLP